MATKRIYLCEKCRYKTEVYEGTGFFGQHISQIVCHRCNTVQNLTVGGIISEIVPSFSSEYGRLCPNCMSDEITLWDGTTCPKCGKPMHPEGDAEFWC